MTAPRECAGLAMTAGIMKHDCTERVRWPCNDRWNYEIQLWESFRCVVCLTLAMSSEPNDDAGKSTTWALSQNHLTEGSHCKIGHAQVNGSPQSIGICFSVHLCIDRLIAQLFDVF